MDPDQAVTELGNRFPRATIWFGDFTGSYWALIRAEDGARLIEGTTPADLSHQLDSVQPNPSRTHQPQSPSSPPTHQKFTEPAPCPAPAAQCRSVHRTSRGRGSCRRRSVLRPLSRSGRC
ncbi:hypothetical protein GCM10009736_70720 [Actinomadura bangladeshensis]